MGQLFGGELRLATSDRGSIFVTARTTVRRYRKRQDKPGVELSRAFSCDEIEVDALAEIVRQLVGSAHANGVDASDGPDLLLKRHRVSHVLGNKEVPAT